MQISSDSVLVFSYYKTDFAVGFKSCKTVNYMTARLFKLCCPLNVVFLVKSRLEFNKNSYLLAVFSRLDKSRNNR